MKDNGKIFDEGMQKARQIIFDHLFNILRGNVITLLHKAAVNREFQGFTSCTRSLSVVVGGCNSLFRL